MALFRWWRDKALECFRQGKLAADREDLDLAFSWFSEAIRIDRGQSLGFFGRGFVHLKKAEYDPAIVDFSEALRLSPRNPMVYFYRSLSYEGKGDEARRRADYEQALDLDPSLDRYITAFWDPRPCGETVTGRPTEGPLGVTTRSRGRCNPVQELP
jgi:tetratricopeptide (TPR) repeat protein